MNGHVEEMYTGHSVVKAFGHERKAVEQFDAVNEELYEAGVKRRFISGIIMPMMMFIGNISYVLISIVVGFLSRNGDLDRGYPSIHHLYTPVHATDHSDANIANIVQSTVAGSRTCLRIIGRRRRDQGSDDTSSHAG
ncbi:ABC transporter transmembrane domain-containing protein [Exiguobacterium acetylicum]|uniref:ABC transporter transmembrane domain-containing protein n=1 Tax=Exiguobacterium acetylicum TaxID=41170 RepID=UPI000A8D01C4